MHARHEAEATNYSDYLQEGTVPRQNLPIPSKQTGNPPMQRRLLPSPLSSPTLTRRHQRTPQPVRLNPGDLPKHCIMMDQQIGMHFLSGLPDMLTPCSGKPQNGETSYVGALKVKQENIILP